MDLELLVVDRLLHDATWLLHGQRDAGAYLHDRKCSVEHRGCRRRGAAGHQACAILGNISDRDRRGVRSLRDLDVDGRDTDPIDLAISVLRAAHGECALAARE